VQGTKSGEDLSGYEDWSASGGASIPAWYNLHFAVLQQSCKISSLCLTRHNQSAAPLGCRGPEQAKFHISYVPVAGGCR